jgi:hypothetical protein
MALALLSLALATQTASHQPHKQLKDTSRPGVSTPHLAFAYIATQSAMNFTHTHITDDTGRWDKRKSESGQSHWGGPEVEARARANHRKRRNRKQLSAVGKKRHPLSSYYNHKRRGTVGNATDATRHKLRSPFKIRGWHGRYGVKRGLAHHKRKSFRASATKSARKSAQMHGEKVSPCIALLATFHSPVSLQFDRNCTY